MTDIPIPRGPSNKELIDLAYLALGVKDTMFGRTEEEYASGALLLRGMMAEWPFDQLGFDDTTARPSEASGIDRRFEQAVGLSLAERIGPSIGKTLSPEFRKTLTRSYARLCSVAGVVPAAVYAPNTIRGTGRRWSRVPFFNEEASVAIGIPTPTPIVDTGPQGPTGPAGPAGPGSGALPDDIETVAVANGVQTIAFTGSRARVLLNGLRLPTANYTIAGGNLTILIAADVRIGDRIHIEAY